MRIVLDVNVLVSAAITYDGPAYDAMELMARDDMYLFLSDAMFITLANVLARPKIVRRLDPNRPSEFMGRLRRLTSEKITPDPTVQGVAEDAEDDGVLGTAVAGSVDYLVTGDGWLLGIGEYRGVRIITPRDFLTLLEAESGS